MGTDQEVRGADVVVADRGRKKPEGLCTIRMQPLWCGTPDVDAVGAHGTAAFALLVT